MQENQDIFFESLRQGKMFLGVGANIFTDITKNEDQVTAYVIDEKDRSFNMKLTYGYFIKDTHPIGIGFKYGTNELNSIYQNLLLDTIDYHDVSSGFYVLPRVTGDVVTLNVSPSGSRSTGATSTCAPPSCPRTTGRRSSCVSSTARPT